MSLLFPFENFILLLLFVDELSEASELVVEFLPTVFVLLVLAFNFSCLLGQRSLFNVRLLSMPGDDEDDEDVVDGDETPEEDDDDEDDVELVLVAVFDWPAKSSLNSKFLVLLLFVAELSN